MEEAARKVAEAAKLEAIANVKKIMSGKGTQHQIEAAVKEFGEAQKERALAEVAEAGEDIHKVKKKIKEITAELKKAKKEERKVYRAFAMHPEEGIYKQQYAKA